MKTNSLKHPLLSFSLVALQFFLIGVLLIQLPLEWNWRLVPFQLTAVLIGLWAIFSMPRARFNILPDPMINSSLVTRGAYRSIRHPMYLSILLFFTPMVVLNNTLISLITLLLLTGILVIKLNYEEHLLQQQFPDYENYQQHSNKLIPFIY